MKALTQEKEKSHGAPIKRFQCGAKAIPKARIHEFHFISANMQLIAHSHKYGERKATVDELACFTVKDYLSGYYFFPDGQKITVSKPAYFSGVPFISLTDDDGCFLQSIYLEYGAQHYGGKRTWLLCPGCKRRCTKLQIYQSTFGCRICFKLSYKSRQFSKPKRHEQQALKIEHRLGENRTYINRPFPPTVPPRPKYMHKKTYSKLLNKLNGHQNIGLAPLRQILSDIMAVI